MWKEETTSIASWGAESGLDNGFQNNEEITWKVFQNESENILIPEFNFGANIGEGSGASIESHLHFHIVPRWKSDTSFMPVIGNTKVMPQTLEDTYEQLLKLFKEEL